MATKVWECVPSVGSEAMLRAWGSSFNAALKEAGATQASDSGQIDWTTQTYPAASDTVLGYEIWRLADTLQSTAPVYLRLEWVTGVVGSIGKFKWNIKVGQATNGAGTLVGPTTSSVTVSPGTYYGANSRHYASCSSNRIAVSTGNLRSDTNENVGFSLERTHSTVGTDTAEGILVIIFSGGYTFQQFYLFESGLVSHETALSALVPSVGGGIIGTAVSVFPCFFTKGVYSNPSTNLLVVFSASVTQLVPFNITILGASRRYIPLPTGSCLPVVRGSISALNFLMRWE